MARAGRRNKSYARRPGKREPGACIRIIICRHSIPRLDGYLQSLIRDTFGLKTRLIEVQEVDPSDFDMGLITLVQDVVEQKTSNEERFKRDCERVLKVDEWWMVADAGFSLERADTEALSEALRLAESNGINLLIDNPSFEYWVLLHACYMAKRFDNAEKLKTCIEKQFETLNCEISLPSLLKRLGNAMVNAATLRVHAEEDLGYDCPSVDLDKLVDRIARYANKTSRKAQRIPTDNRSNSTAIISDETVRHVARLCWRGLRQVPGQVIPYELRLYDSVVATVDVSMSMDGKRSYEIVDVTDNTKLLPLPFAEDRTERGFKAWLKTRTIPQGQEYAFGVLERAGVNVKDRFSQIELGFGLSLTDAYWIAPQGLSWTWAYVNLYESGIQDNLSMSIYDPKHKIEVPTGLMAGDESADRYFNISPAYGVGGTFKKAWHKDGEVYILRKSGSERCSANAGQEPWSEFVAAQVAEAMGIEHVAYGLEYFQGELVSTCKLLNSERKALVPALAVIGDNHGDFFSTMASFAALGEDALDAFRDMIVFDCLICNTDRHANNHGFLRDNATGIINAIAPLFDHNYSLFPYDMPYNYDEWRSGERPRTYDECRPRLTDASKYMTFDAQAAYVLGHNQREKIRRLLGPGVRFRNVEGGEAIPEDRLNAWQDFITVRANQLLSMKTVNDREIQSAIKGRAIAREDLPAIRLGLIEKGSLRRSNPA